MKYYCIGIKGAGMSTLANILYDLGNEVSGYDDSREYKFTMDGLIERGIPIYYDKHDLDKDVIVTYSKAFSCDHKEIQRVKKEGLVIKNYNEVVGDITKMFDTVGISGTHGKTTTSFLISHILKSTIGCNYFVGDGSGYVSKDNNIFVIESDEYNKHFLAYHPQIAVITNIELDHVECYDGLEDIINTFAIFANKAKLAIACGDDQNIRKINFKNKVIYYGFNDDNDVVAKNVELTDRGSNFDVYMNGEFYYHFDLPLYGKHMILNALASIIVCHNYNLTKEDIYKYMKTFEGAKRRFKEEIIGDIVTIDDYAHHPTEIKVTLQAAKQKYPNKEIVAIFLPNTYSRTEALMDDFIDVLKNADKAYIMDIHCDREKQEDYPNVSSDQLIAKIPNSEKISLDDCSKLLKHKNSVLCFMSCTNIYVLLDQYKKLLKKTLKKS